MTTANSHLKQKRIEVMSDLIETDDVSSLDINDKRATTANKTMTTSHDVTISGGMGSAGGRAAVGSGATLMFDSRHLLLDSVNTTCSQLVEKVCGAVAAPVASPLQGDKSCSSVPNSNSRAKIDFSGTLLVKSEDRSLDSTKQLKLKNAASQLFDQSENDTSLLLTTNYNTSNCHHLYNGGTKTPPVIEMAGAGATGRGAGSAGATAAEVCHGCGKNIMDKYLLSVNGFAWHQNCLKCAACSIPLNNQASCYVTKDNSVYCKADYLRFFGVKCAKCSRVVSATDWVRRAKQLVYHLACFACNVCHRQLSTGEEFALHECHVLCKQHYLELLEIPPPVITSNGGRGGGLSYGATSNGSLANAGKGDASHSGDSSSPNTDSQEDGVDMDTNIGSPHKSKRSRTTFSEDQLKVLQANFNLDSNPDGQDLERIAQQTGLSKRVIQVWFQNARSRQKKHLSTSAAGNTNPNNIYNTAAAKMHPHVIPFGPNCDELSPNTNVALM